MPIKISSNRKQCSQKGCKSIHSTKAIHLPSLCKYIYEFLKNTIIVTLQTIPAPILACIWITSWPIKKAKKLKVGSLLDNLNQISAKSHI